jgi:hypothetical protein
LVQDHQIDSERLEFRSHCGQMAHALRQPVKLHAGHHVEVPPAGISQKAVQSRPAAFRPADSVIDVLLGNLEVSRVGVGSEGVELDLGTLIGGAELGVEGNTLLGRDIISARRAQIFVSLAKCKYEV